MIGEQIRAQAPLSGINQTSFAFGAVMFAFLFFITCRGDLGKWLGVLGLAGTTGATGTTGTTGATSALTLPNNSAINGLPSLPALGSLQTATV